MWKKEEGSKDIVETIVALLRCRVGHKIKGVVGGAHEEYEHTVNI